MSKNNSNNISIQNSNRTALIIGATSSLAYSICTKLATDNYNLILCARDKQEVEMLKSDLEIRYGIRIYIVIADLSDKNLDTRKLEESFGDYDELYLLAGSMGDDDDDDVDNLDNITTVNYTNPAKLLTIAAKNFSDRRSETSIVIVSSVAGDRGRQSNYFYGASKSALTEFASGLRNRFAKTSLNILTVKPGFVDTPLTFDLDSPLIASREYVADKIIKAVRKKKNVIYVPFFWKFIMLVIIHIPEVIFKRMKL